MAYRFDSLLGESAGIFFDRELVDVRTEIVEQVRPPKNIFLYFAQDTSKSEWANQYEHRSFDVVGEAQFIADYADDLPIVDLAGREEVFNMRTFGCAYQYSIEEIKASQALGRELDRKRALGCRLVTEEKFDRIGFYGDPATQLFGWLNYPYMPRRISSVSFTAGTDADVMLAEMNAAVNSIFGRTNTIGTPNLYGLSPNAYTQVTSRRLANSDLTVLEHFLRANPSFSEGKGRVVPIWELAGAGPNGEDLDLIGSDDEMVGAHVIARPFTQEPPQARNLAMYTPCHAKSGGVYLDRPLEFLLVERPVA